MIISLLNSRNRIWWILFHILLGIAAVVSKNYVIFWFYFTLAVTVYLVSQHNTNKPLLIAGLMVYIGAFELLARMTKCSPLIPWEASKYIFTVLSVAGIFFSTSHSHKRNIGVIILLLLLPSVFIDRSGFVVLSDIVFNIMGLVNIGLGMIFFGSLKMSKQRFFDFFRLMFFPCLSILTYTIIKTPDLSEINFSLSAQTVTSGEFGSNQVSTVLGFGFFLMVVAWILNWKITGFRIGDGILATVFLVQGLFTFSRGGMIVGGLGLLVFLFSLFYKNNKQRYLPTSIKQYTLPVLIILILAVFYANELTEGDLLLRYQGETEGTLIGQRDRDLSTITSGRDMIFLSDLMLWWEYPLFGSGAGTSKYLREEGPGAAAHIEMSRLLAEHGIFGLIIFILLLHSLKGFFKEPDSRIKAIKISLFCIAIFTTFHSATRTFITPLLISFCMVNVKEHINIK